MEQEYFGYCDRCGSKCFYTSPGWKPCKWGRCNGSVNAFRTENRLPQDEDYIYSDNPNDDEGDK